MKKLFEINGLISEYAGEKMYIYGTDKRAWQLFRQCCSLRIPIEGYVEKKSDIEFFFNKPVFKEEKLEEKAVLLVPRDYEGIIKYCGRKVFCDSVLNLNIENTDKKIIIYGAGVCGRQLLKFLRNLYLHVDGFMETTVSNAMMIEGVPVYSIDILESLTEDTMVICAGKYYEEMCLTVAKYAPHIECYCVTLGDLYTYIDKEYVVFDRIDGRKKSCIGVISNLEEFYKEKTIWLYGGEYQMMCEDKEIYNLLGYPDIVIATDDEANGTENILNYLNEENAVIFVYDKDKVDKLETLGLKEGEDYIWGGAPGANKIWLKCYDINVGQAYKAYGKTDGECVCPGIYRYGAHEEADFIIMVLGGSTSEEVREWWKAWPYILYQKLIERDKKVTIYNCANSGYTAAQELLRYLRDGAVINPDLVISYSGANDIHKLYDAGFNLRSLKYAGELYTSHNGQEMTVGLEDKRDAFDIWLDNLKCIQSLVHMRGSKYIAFAHPFFCAKKEYKTQHEKQLERKIRALYSAEDIDGSIVFREKVRDVHEDFIVDFSDIFDEEDVYYDICHVNEKGNSIIASKIYKEISDRELIH